MTIRWRAGAEKPRLLVDKSNPHQTVATLRDILADAGGLYDRGVPVRLAVDQTQKGTVAQMMTRSGIVLMSHQVCRPYALKKGQPVDVGLPSWFALMYLEWWGEWQLAPLNGVASAPLLQDDGTINSTEGYDPASGMWCENVPDLTGLISESPTRNEAEEALRLIRETFKTFCYADAETLDDPSGIAVVDTGKAPGRDESSFLVALLTAVCRPSLYLAPGVLLRAASLSGAGAGKGLLARCICIIAFGRDPHAVTAGATAEELEKRIAAELMEGSPSLFLDNLNNTAFRSDLLASAITERPARVRLLGKSQMVPLNASTFVILTGNGLSVSEDLARRFITVEFDPRTEDPEARPFRTDIRAEVRERRAELLAPCLTIWRWGRIALLTSRRAVRWAASSNGVTWVRDPLLALGCPDPVERVARQRHATGAGRRSATCSLSGGQRIAISQCPLAAPPKVKALVDPQGQGASTSPRASKSLPTPALAGFVLSGRRPREVGQGDLCPQEDRRGRRP